MSMEKRIFSGCVIILMLHVGLPITGMLTAGGLEAKAEKAIKTWGGSFKRDDKVEGKPIITVNLEYSKVTDADLKELAGL